MNHVALARDVAARLGIPIEDARQMVMYVFCAMFEGFITDGEVDYQGFMRIDVRPVPGRRARHVQTGEIIQISDGIRFRSKAHGKLDEALNPPKPPEEKF